MIGHKYYNVKRRKGFIDSVSNLIYNINEDYLKYKSKIIGFVNDNNINLLAKQLFMKPNIVLSIIGRNNQPLLCLIGNTQNRKMFILFLQCLFHFDKIILGNNDIINNNGNDNKLFVSKYLNYNKCNDPIIHLSYTGTSFVKLFVFFFFCFDFISFWFFFVFFFLFFSFNFNSGDWILLKLKMSK